MKYVIRFSAFIPALLVSVSLLAQTSTPAQTATAPAPAPTPVATPAPTPTDPKFKAFQEKFAEYQQTAEQISKLQEEFEKAARAGEQDKVKEIQTKALTLMKQAETTFMATVPLAKEAYNVSDGQNEELNQFMLVYANYLLTVDNYDDAYKMFAQFLSKGMHKKNPEVFEMAGVSAFGSNRFAAAEKCFNYAKQTKTPLSRQATAYAESITEYYTQEWARELKLQQRDAQANNLPQVLIRTSVGDMVVELFENEAPNTVANFITLVESGYYNGLIFHRVLPGFMAQGGCPKGDGTGGPGYTIPEEYTKEGARYHFRGSLAMARSMDPNSAGSQFYITFLPNQSLDKNYTVFGRVIEGMPTLSNIERIDPERPYAGQAPSKIIEMKVLRKQNTDYSKFKKM